MSTTRGFAAKHPTLVYFAMTFAISWGGALMAIDASGAPPRRFFPASSFRMRTSPFCWSASRWDYRPASSRNWLDGLRHPDAETPFQHPGNRIDRRRLVECVAPVTERLVEPRGIRRTHHANVPDGDRCRRLRRIPDGGDRCRQPQGNLATTASFLCFSAVLVDQPSMRPTINHRIRITALATRPGRDSGNANRHSATEATRSTSTS